MRKVLALVVFVALFAACTTEPTPDFQATVDAAEARLLQSLTAVPTPTATPTPTIAPLDPQPRLRGFVPLDDPSFITAEADTFIGDDELVLGYDQDGEARAYPVSMMHWHHIINDTVQGQPLLVTY
jgi:hypothetical protein